MPAKPSCPQCGKSFEEEIQVQRHLDQPRTKCHQRPTTFADAAELLEQFAGPSHILRQQHRHFQGRFRHDSLQPDPEYFPDGRTRSVQRDALVTDYYPGAARVVHQHGTKFMDAFDQDRFAKTHNTENLYYPFVDRPEWELADFLVTSDLSMAAIDRFLSLPLIRQLHLSFQSANQLRGLVEILPSPPPWKCQHVDTSPHQTKTVARLFYRDTVECLQTLLHNPLFTDSIDFSPYRVFTTAQRLVQVYSKWMSGDIAWRMQIEATVGRGCVLGVILSSDKTHITNQSGGKVSHPLLMSLANIRSEVRKKVSHHAFVPVAFLPVVDFIHNNQRMKSVLSDRLYHQCLDIVVKPLKIAAQIGIMLSDPLGNSRQSPSTVLNPSTFDPNNLVAYLEACGEHQLNGVALPFWRDWSLSDPAYFLTPEILHTFFRFSYDHDLAWCIRAVSLAEIDFRFSILQPITNHRHFATGITKLKQVTRRTQRDFQRYLIAVIAGAAPAGLVRAVCSLVDFRYLAQSPIINSDQCRKISAALEGFHTHKQCIINAGARCREKGQLIEHWEIPKLELMQSVTPSIPLVGPPIHWTADTTERAHIDVVKNPAAVTNNVDFESQICRNLDRHEKCRTFSLALHLRKNEVGSQPTDDNADLDSENNPQHEQDVDSDVEPLEPDELVLGVAPRRVHNYFTSSAKPSTVFPPRSFISGPVAFHLGFHPAVGSMGISDVAEKYGLPDLHPALVHYFCHNHDDRPLAVGGQRYDRTDVPLPFQRLQVWHKVRLQQMAYHDPTAILPAQTLNASPPATGWPRGRYDAALVNVDHSMVWPHSGLKGHIVCEIRLIFRPIPPRGLQDAWWSTKFLVYVARLDIVSVHGRDFDEVTGMRVVRRVTRACGTPTGDVILLSQLRALAPLVPKFGGKANACLTAQTSSYYSNQFYLNHHFNKELYYALCS
ncbi:hypothetical protein EDD15DRAFT_2155216 [Pisolithus albus]|nr:hypothetical protein EDD15DRAFT_2155216 [Pisolithus albus]